MSAPEILIATLMRRDGDTGVQSHFQTFHRWLLAHGHSAQIVTPFDAPLWQVYPVFALRRLVEMASRPWSVWWYRHWHQYFLCRALNRRLSAGADCVVYAQCPPSARAALAARSTPRQRVVMVVHFNVSQADEWVGKGMLSPTHRLFRAIRDLENTVLPQVDGLVFVSGFMQREIVARVPDAAGTCSVVIPNFVDTPPLVDQADPTSGDLISIGTLEPRKNQAYLIEIIAATRSLGNGLRLTLVGDGPDRQQLESLCRQLGVADLVSFAGHVSHGSALIPQFKACIHAARIENLPITLIEALSHGCPVFAPAVGGIPEVFDDGREGRVIPLDDAMAAARTVLSWWDQPSCMAAARGAALARFRGKFETETVAAKLAQFLAAQLTRG